ncbi:MAG TPA: tetraacyldisaccharide 4'-kinase [Vicinamibacterales bacterium]
MSALSAVYGGVTRLRRSWYERRPASRTRLPRPVISIGNLSVGGSGKTPIVAAVAHLLLALGQRPAILSRGYRRRSSADLVVVSDGTGPRVPVEESGDEPQMLARDLAGVPVVVSADRARAGRLAIERFGASVLLLDDGYQHVQLERTIDLLVLSAGDLGERVLPSGRLREPLSAARGAHAVLVYGSAQEAKDVAARVGVARAFGVSTQFHPLRSVSAALPPESARVVAVAGIGRPERFFDALRRQGHEVVREHTFPDHHWFTEADVQKVEQSSQESVVDCVVTTAKDAVRLEHLDHAMRLPWAILPITVTIDPSAEFESWLRRLL